MRHLFIVEVDADDSISAETVDTLFTVSTLANHIRAIANKCKTEEKANPEKPRQPDIRDLNIGLIKSVCSFKPINPRN